MTNAKVIFCFCYFFLLVGLNLSNGFCEQETLRSNIVLIMIDTLRADHLYSYGYTRLTSPFIDSLAQEGTKFSRGFCQIPTTGPSTACLFTSLYPRNHGLLKNGWRLNTEAHTVAEILTENGYYTCGIVGAFNLNRAFNMNQGFREYHDEFAKAVGKDVSLEEAEGVRSWEGTGYEGKFHIKADEVTKRVMDWLRANKMKPFFLFVHYFDPHDPYDEPEPFRSAFKHVFETRLSERVRLYDGEILFVDSQVRFLVQTLKDLDLHENTYVLLTADHGEGLGDHSWLKHGFMLYEEALHVPLIICGPDVPEGKVVPDLVELIDLAPTILDLAGINLSVENRFVGRSLVRLIKGTAAETIRPEHVIAQRRWYKIGSELKDLSGKVHVIQGLRYVIRDSTYKLIFDDYGEDELYNLLEDPGERTNIAKERSEVVKRLKDEWSNIISDSLKKCPPFESRPADKEAIEKLKALGYLQ